MTQDLCGQRKAGLGRPKDVASGIYAAISGMFHASWKLIGQSPAF